MISPISDDKSAPPTRRGLAAILIATFIAIACWIVRDAVGEPSINWMKIYRAADFPDVGSTLAFLMETRLPLPPVLTLAELLNHAWNGTTELVTVWVYRFCLVAAFALALWRARRSTARLLISCALALVFLVATTVIHPAGPWVYDLLLPTLLLGFFAFFDRMEPERPSTTAALLAGICLTLAELTRPYMIVLMPILLLGAALRLRRLPVTASIAFLVPVLLLSGGWHLHQYLDFGQVAWSNHGGYNLLNAWPMIEVPALLPEANLPQAPGRTPNFDTATHGENSRRLVAAVLSYLAENPVRGTTHMIERLAYLLSAPTMFFKQYPEHWILPVYQIAARYAGLYVLVAAAAVAAGMLLRPGNAGAVLSDGDNLLLLTTAAMIGILAIGDHGEEARFLLSALPLLAAVPKPQLGAREHRTVAARRRLRIAAITAAVVTVLAVEIVMAGAMRRPTGAAEGRLAAISSLQQKPTGNVRLLAMNIRGRHWRDADAVHHGLQQCLVDADVAALLEAAAADPLRGENGQVERLAHGAGMAAVFAPAERRWWREHTGNAVLSRLPSGRWWRIPLPRINSSGYRNMLRVEVAWGNRTINVIVAQVDFADDEAQFAAIKDAFDALPTPAVLFVDLLGPYAYGFALPALRADRSLSLLQDEEQFPGRGPSSDIVLVRGLNSAVIGRCPGVEPHRPGLLIELAPID